jgi:Sulfatase-modifying factor enzyme 1
MIRPVSLALASFVALAGLGCAAHDDRGAAGSTGIGGSSGGSGGGGANSPDSGSSSASGGAAGADTSVDGSPRDAESEATTDDAGDGSNDALTDAAAPYENTLGMRFLPVSGTTVLFSIWETRVRDYEAFAAATGAQVPHPEFPEEPLSPKASISRAQAEAFAVWLSGKEHDEGKLDMSRKYRLPTDAEWDAAIDLGNTGGPYPWGTGFPPPDHFANYQITNDGFEFTAPVGSFPPNRLGLYDLFGNLWEWIGEGCAQGRAYLVRGAGWNAHTMPYFELPFHDCFADDLVGHHNVGFRVVLEGGAF